MTVTLITRPVTQAVYPAPAVAATGPRYQPPASFVAEVNAVLAQMGYAPCAIGVTRMGEAAECPWALHMAGALGAY